MAKTSSSKASRAGRETDPTRLRTAMLSRVARRSALSARLSLPAVPSMLDTYLAHLEAVLLPLGRVPSEEQKAELRERISGAIDDCWMVSPHGIIHLRVEADGTGTESFSVSVTAAPSSLEAQYDTWTTTREPPFFGTFPDARLMALLPELPEGARVLDVGAGMGRNALYLAREGLTVDFIEPTRVFARAVLAGAQDEDLLVRQLPIDFLATEPALEADYDLVLLSEVTSHFRVPSQLRRTFERAAEALRPGGYLLLNIFVTEPGYTPERRARELSQAFWSTMFTPNELAQATEALPLELVDRTPVQRFEHEHLPPEAMPLPDWYEEWVSGLDVFALSPERCPIVMWWLLYQRV